MKKTILFLSILVFSVFFVLSYSCKKDEELEIKPTLLTGKIKGTVLAENGTTPIPMANVFLVHDSEVYLTQSDRNGSFLLTAPAGEHTLHIQAGKGTIFRSQVNVVIKQWEVIELPEMDLRIGQEAPLAFVSGTFDAIEYIVTEGLGYEITELTANDLNDLAVMFNYAGIFLNCHFTNSLTQNQWTNIHAFVANGGGLYVSDWAVNSLIGNVGGKIFDRSCTKIPDLSKNDCFDRQGGFIPYNQLCTERIGPATTIENADIESLALSSWLGQQNINIVFDKGSWEVVLNYGNMWEVLIADNSPQGYGPLAIRANIGTETIGGFKNNNQEWITICHYPPGNPENAQTLTIPISAWPAFEALGATLGPCEGEGGTIIFTTFHNHPGGQICSEIEQILEFFIFNL